MLSPKYLPFLLFLLPACRSRPEILDPAGDPTILMQTPEGMELGVATDFGVVFLGVHQRSGSVEFVVFYDDGPSIEAGVIEPLGAGLYTTAAEILLPSVPLTFKEPKPGTKVMVRGRDEDGSWDFSATVERSKRVEGVLLEPSRSLDRLRDDQLGAGVYVVEDGVRSLVGLVSGKLRLSSEDGWREFYTVVGPRELWRLVTHHRNRDRPRRWVHREDIET